MKKLFFLFAASLLLAACQVINEADRLIPVDSPEPVSRALITECTGFRCVNCPNAAEMAHQLLETYPDNLVVVELHPKSNSFCQTTIDKYDYTCPEADSLYQWLGGTSTTGFPTGVVNLTSGMQDYLSWSTYVASAVCKARKARISMNCASAGGRDVSVVYTVDVLQGDSIVQQKAPLRVMIWLIEDNIVGPQMMPDGSQNMDYVHNHVLRCSLMKSVFGEVSDHWHNSYSNGVDYIAYTVPEMNNGQTIDLSHCSIVGIVADPDTYEVLDVELAPIQ